MLRLPIPDEGLTAGCNFAIAQTLTSAIGGVSTTLHAHRGGSGQRFKDLLGTYYPWDLEPTQTVTPKQGAEVIYSLFRNPLVHNLGLDIGKKARTRKVNVKRLATNDGRRGLSEETIEQIEDTKKRFQKMSATVTVSSDSTVLLLEALHWGTRVMIERLVNDAPRMKRADAYLASL